MKHGQRFWQKKLNRTPAHRASLLKNLVTELVVHERIQTTVPKAKFMQRSANKLIELAKNGKYQQAKSLLQIPQRTLPKVVGVLAKRYENRHGTYTRILKAGHSPYLDRAPMAFVEFVDSPKDTVHALAQSTLPVLERQLADVRNQRYRKERISLIDPSSGSSALHYRLSERQDLPLYVFNKLAARENALLKKIARMKASLSTWPDARKTDEQSFATAKERVEAKTAVQVTAVQQEVDKRMAYYGQVHPEYIRDLRRNNLDVDRDGKVITSMARYLEPVEVPSRLLKTESKSVAPEDGDSIKTSSALPKDQEKSSPSESAESTKTTRQSTVSTGELKKESELSGLAKLFSRLAGVGKPFMGGKR